MIRPRVVVIGGGVAGLSVAYFLRRREVEVTVLESNRIGSGASTANAGWLCPAQAGPVPEPGLAAYGVRSLIDGESALYFAPTQVPRMLGWLLRFAGRCNERDLLRGTRALAQLGRRTFELAEVLADDGVDCEIRRDGLLVVGSSREQAERFLAKLQPLRELGIEVPEGTLSAAQLREAEPILTDRAGSGLSIGGHWHVHPPSYIEALARRVREMGAVLEEGAEASEVIARKGGRLEVRTAAGSWEAGAVVLAAGAWSTGLARTLGFGLPVQAGKGYSFEVVPETVPRRAMLLLDPHVGCSPLGDRLRLAGTMEFSGVNSRLDEARIDSIARGARSLIAGIDGQLESVRCGMRPIAPDGLPIIDHAPGWQNLYVATGYSMLGMTIAAPAAEDLTEFMLSGQRPASLEPFRATRFARRLLPIRGRSRGQGSHLEIQR